MGLNPKEQAEKDIRENIEGAATNLDQLKELVKKHPNAESLNYVAKLLGEKNVVTEKHKNILASAKQRLILNESVEETGEIDKRLNVLDRRLLDLEAYLGRPVIETREAPGKPKEKGFNLVERTKAFAGSVSDISVATGTAVAGIGSWLWNGTLSGLNSTGKFLSDFAVPENMSRRGSYAYIFMLSMLKMEGNSFVGPWIAAQISSARKNIASCDIARTIREEKAEDICLFNGEIGEAEWEEYYAQVKGPPFKTEPSMKVLTHKFIESVRKQNPQGPMQFAFSDIQKKSEQLAQDNQVKKNAEYLNRAKSALPETTGGVTILDSGNEKITIDLDKRAVTIPSLGADLYFSTINSILLAQSSSVRKFEIETNNLITKKQVRVSLDVNNNAIVQIRKDADNEVIQAIIGGKLNSHDLTGRDEKIFELISGEFVQQVAKAAILA